MLIPIGLDKTEVRRLPWITFGIIIACFVVFVLTGLGGTTNEEEAAEAWERGVAYFREHPYLEIPQDLLDIQPSERARDDFKAQVEFLRQAGNKPPEEPGVVEQEQHELDRLWAAFHASENEHPFHKWGLKPGKTTLLAFLTCMFIHAGWLHLIGNMLILYLSGPFVEDAFGRPMYLGLYLTSGIAASLAQVLAFPGSDTPLGGASGAIAGVMGAFLIRYSKTKIKFFYWFGLVFTGTFEAPAWLMLPLWLGQQLFFASMGIETGTAYWAHIGGFVYGLVVAATIAHFKIEQKYISPTIEKKISVTQHPALEEGMAALARGDASAARELIRTVLAEDPRNTDAHLAMWHCCTAEQHPQEGVDSLSRVMDEELRRGEVVLATAHWRELVTQAGVGGPALLRMRLAAAVEPAEPETAKEILRQLAGDPAAGLLADKAVKRLAVLGETFVPPPVKEPEPPPPVAPPLLPDEPDPFAAAAEPQVPAQRWLVEITNLISLQEDGLVIQGTQGGTELLPFASIRAVAVAGIAAQPRPYLLLDLVLRGVSTEPDRVVRLFSSSFDPRRILGRSDLQPMAAFRTLIAGIATSAGAGVAPEGVLGEQGRFTTFSSVEAYEDTILVTLCPGAA